ncbi:winged helix-turn-helix domain-containing protein [Nonomuraea wenchangensis]|uniref:Helix-turn-helix domain-containing protein n=1 Tax=Nonomuraea wenchangensis TaxID=568860 RepID=A0A1I0LF61_9ACTN|nr:winged helix-turn-helix domain-containing protein [Nonomuraea wenchangensis]SEU38715.1 hypothetical protein SAMN05421811_11611 [Nonomuraea wenchangensis]
MNSVSVRTVERVFAEVPETTVFSDYVTSAGIRVIALVLASKSDHSAYGSGIRWPIFTASDIAEKLRMSESTVKRTVAQLKRDGFLRTTKTQQGNRYEILVPAFENDTYRGKPNISHRAKSQVEMSVITADISDEAFHLLYMLEATGKSYEAVRIPQSKLRTYFKSPRPKDDDPYISLRQLNTWLRELEGAGLLDRRRLGQMEQNEYILNKESIVRNGVEISNMIRLPEQLTSVKDEPAEELAYDVAEDTSGAGMSLAMEFKRTVKRYQKDKDWSDAIRRPNAINLPALASTFNRWIENGTSYADIVRMIELYPLVAPYGADQACVPAEVRERLVNKPIWQDFIGRRADLYERVEKIKEDEIRFNPEAEGYAEYWGVKPEDVKPFETPKTWGELQAERQANVFAPVVDDDPLSPANRLARYLGRIAS